jgi:hypothetical protein
MAADRDGDLSNSWNVLLAGIPSGLGVASVNIAKHIDKHDDDNAKGAGTFPVRVGEALARRVDQVAILLIYAVIAYPVFVPRYFTPVMLMVFPAFKHAWNVIKVLNDPRPAQPPPNWPGRQTWFSGFAFFHNRQFGGWLVLALIVDILLHVISFTAGLIARYWPPCRLRYIDILDFQPCGFEVLQDSKPDFSFRGKGCILVIDPNHQSQRGMRTHGRLKHEDIIHFEYDLIRAPIKPVTVPFSDIYTEADSILIDHFSQLLPRHPA